MKHLRVPLSPTRRRRCEAIVENNEKFIAEEVAYLARCHPKKFVAMLTDEAVEELAFKYMVDRVLTNTLHARNRALYAKRAAEVGGAS